MCIFEVLKRSNDTKQNIMITKQELIEQAQRELERSFKFLANGELSKYVKSQKNVDDLNFRITLK